MYKLLLQLYQVQQGRCFYCPRWISLRLKDSYDPNSATVDHFIPLSLGGRDSFLNVVLACPGCNAKKGNSHPCLRQILLWNKLSKLWPHIQPLTLDLHVREKKRCIACEGFIPPLRLLESIKSNAETKTCSKACWAMHKKVRRAQTRGTRDLM